VIPHLDSIATVTLFIFVAGLIYDAGKKAEQLRALREWRDAFSLKFDDVRTAMARMEGILLGKESTHDA
jgi:hypothetical protein